MIRLPFFLCFIFPAATTAHSNEIVAEQIRSGFRYEATAKLTWSPEVDRDNAVLEYDLSYVSSGKDFRIHVTKRGLNGADKGFVEAGFDGRYHYGRYSNDFLQITTTEETAHEKFAPLIGSVELLTLPFAANGGEIDDIYSVASHRSSHDVAEGIAELNSMKDSARELTESGWMLKWSDVTRCYPDTISSEVSDDSFRFEVGEWATYELGGNEISFPRTIEMVWFEGQTEFKKIHFEVTKLEFGPFDIPTAPFSSAKYVNDLDEGVSHLSELAFENGEPKVYPSDAAKVALDAARVKAAKESKLLFVKSGFPECGWCQDFDRFHGFEEVRQILGKHYVVVSIDTRYMPDGIKVFSEFAEPATPSWVIISPDKKVIVDSYSESGNVGFPFRAHEVAYYTAALQRASSQITDEELKVIAVQLKRALDQ